MHPTRTVRPPWLGSLERCEHWGLLQVHDAHQERDGVVRQVGQLVQHSRARHEGPVVCLQLGESKTPFFLFYTFTAPHAPAIPDNRDIGRFPGPLPEPPSFKTADANDPKYTQSFNASRTLIA